MAAELYISREGKIQAGNESSNLSPKIIAFELKASTTELSDAFSTNYAYGSITHAIGRLAYTIVQGNCLVKVVGQESFSVPLISW